jgi:signal transduction histidine kinase
VIKDEVHRAAEAVKNLLVFSRKHGIPSKSLDLNEIILKVLKLRAYEQRIGNITTVTRLDDDLPKVNGDFFHFQHILLNIILNAEYFMKQSHSGGTITITSKYLEENGTVKIEIADDGPGIDEESITRVFGQFYTTKGAGNGTGLGLCISKILVEKYGGEIDIDSSPGQGTTFILELPVEPPALPESPNI